MPEKTSRILFVDDEENLLNAFRRSFGRRFSVSTANSGQEGLRQIETSPPFDVIVSDMKMPAMTGTEFLSRVREKCPDSVRIMLTGVNDLAVATQAVNEGNIFRFLTKPCSSENLTKALDAALEQHQLLVAERELLEKTLQGAIQVMTDVLALVSPVAFGRASRIKRYVKALAKVFDPDVSNPSTASPQGVRMLDSTWQLEMAAALSQIGCVSLPPDILERLFKTGDVTADERELFESHPEIGQELLEKIPRLEAVAEIIYFQEKHYDGTGSPLDEERRGNDIPMGSRILKAVLDYDVLMIRGSEATDAIAEMRSRRGWYDPNVLKALERFVGLESRYQSMRALVKDLLPGMILAKDVVTKNNRMLIAKGYELNQTMIQHLRKFENNEGIREPLTVLVEVREAVPQQEVAV